MDARDVSEAQIRAEWAAARRILAAVYKLSNQLCILGAPEWDPISQDASDLMDQALKRKWDHDYGVHRNPARVAEDLFMYARHTLARYQRERTAAPPERVAAPVRTTVVLAQRRRPPRTCGGSGRPRVTQRRAASGSSPPSGDSDPPRPRREAGDASRKTRCL